MIDINELTGVYDETSLVLGFLYDEFSSVKLVRETFVMFAGSEELPVLPEKLVQPASITFENLSMNLPIEEEEEYE